MKFKQKYQSIIVILSLLVSYNRVSSSPDLHLLGPSLGHFAIDSNFTAVCAQATIVVDAAWSVLTLQNGWKHYIQLRIISKENINQEIYTNSWTGSEMDFAPPSSISFDHTKINAAEFDSIANWELTSGDTLKNIFLIQCMYGNGKVLWQICVTDGLFMQNTSQPFALSEALRFLNTYLVEKNKLIGYSPPPDGLKIGPIFYLHKGDPGWQLKAAAQMDHWYFHHSYGYGDCPCGCTQWDDYFYKVYADGKVIEDNVSLIQADGKKSSATHHNSFKTQNKLLFSRKYPIEIFDLSGKKILKMNPAILDLTSLPINNGVYLLRYGSSTEKLVINTHHQNFRSE